jgi:hypothetical protein
MDVRDTAWGLGASAAAHVVLVAATFAWVAVYSHGVAPGQPLAAYEAHAQVAGPWVAVLGGVPLFYAIGRRGGPTRAQIALAGYVGVDGVLLLVLGPTPSALGWAAVSYSTKAWAAIRGGRR